MVIETASQNFPVLTSNTMSKIVKPAKKKKKKEKSSIAIKEDPKGKLI